MILELSEDEKILLQMALADYIYMRGVNFDERREYVRRRYPEDQYTPAFLKEKLESVVKFTTLATELRQRLFN